MQEILNLCIIGIENLYCSTSDMSFPVFNDIFWSLPGLLMPPSFFI